MGREVFVIGCGCTQFGNRWDAGPELLAAQACSEALADAGLTVTDVEAAWLGAYFPATAVGGSFLARAVGLRDIPITHVENLCATGSDAVRQACMAVGAGECDVALVCGVEKLTDYAGRGLPPEPAEAALARLVDVNQFAFFATRCFHEYGWTRDDLASVAVQNHRNGAAHPKAYMRQAIDKATALGSPSVSEPLGLFDCCPVSDGAAAVLVAARDVAIASVHRDALVRMRAATLATSRPHPFFTSGAELTGFDVTRHASRSAFAAAGIREPAKEIDVAEVHDCFTITELIDIQDIGLCEAGAAVRFFADANADIGGEIAINPSGGLKAFGHPIGATGVRMTQEIVRQLQGRAEGNQVPDANVGMVQNLGGLGAVCVVLIMDAVG